MYDGSLLLWREKIYVWMSHPNIDLFASQQQTTVVHVADTIQPSSCDRRLVYELRQDARICSPPFHIIPAILQKIRSHRCRLVLINTILASSFLVPRTSSAISRSSHISSVSSRPHKSTKRKVLASKSSDAISSRLDIIKQSVRNRKFSEEVADHVSEARRPIRKIKDAKWENNWCCRRKMSYSCPGLLIKYSRLSSLLVW